MRKIIDGATQLLGVVGHPIAQVRAPEVWSALFRHNGFNAMCIPLHVEPSDLDAFFKGVRVTKNFAGVIVTIPHNQWRLAHLLRCDTRAILRMTQARGHGHLIGLVATVRTMQVCRRCASRHQIGPATRGARLRSWMEGWRIGCPVCGAALEDVRPLDRVTKADRAAPLLASTAEQARAGEVLMTRAARAGQAGKSVVALMRSMLLPRVVRLGETPSAEVPRLLDTVVPGFDRFLQRSYPGFRRPGTMLLPIGVRIPVLAGVGQVASHVDLWAERLLGAIVETARPGLLACWEKLLAIQSASTLRVHKPRTGRGWMRQKVLMIAAEARNSRRRVLISNGSAVRQPALFSIQAAA